MTSSIFSDNPNKPPPVVTVEGGWIAHVYCDGARWHILSWSTIGAKCSEPHCIINKPKATDKG